jgi:transcriptional regulator with XRE-family HTH domain
VRYILHVVKKIKLRDYVREVASQKNLSDREIEKRSRKGITASYIGDIKNGQVDNPSVKKLQALARGLGVSEDEIFRVARGVPIEEADNPVESQLLEKFGRLSGERQQEILKLLDFYDSLDLNIHPAGQSGIRIMTADEWADEDAGPDIIDRSIESHSPGGG